MLFRSDGDMIVPAVNKVAGKEIRAVPYMHWWTFFGYFMESGECLFNTVVGIRSKKAKGERLDKWEKKFYQENQNTKNKEDKILNTFQILVDQAVCDVAEKDYKISPLNSVLINDEMVMYYEVDVKDLVKVEYPEEIGRAHV